MSTLRERAPFRFRQFSVSHSRSTMPVGTDAVLLAAWVGVEGCGTILDAGTGCGVIALVLAQRCDASVTGIDTHEASVAEAKENALASPWPERLSFIHCSLEEYASSHASTCDLVISNPPYFSGDLRSPSGSRSMARHAQTMNPSSFIASAAGLLNPEGRIALVVPYTEYGRIRTSVLPRGMTITRITEVATRPGMEPGLVLLELGPDRLEKRSEELLVLRDATGKPGEEYRRLTAPFYTSLK